MIVLTARHGPDATAEGLAAGADDYITKPFSTDELLARVHATTNCPGSGDRPQARAGGEQLRAGLEATGSSAAPPASLMTSHRLSAALALLAGSGRCSASGCRVVAGGAGMSSPAVRRLARATGRVPERLAASR